MDNASYQQGYRDALRAVLENAQRGVQLLELEHAGYIPVFWGVQGPALQYMPAKELALAALNGLAGFLNQLHNEFIENVGMNVK